ncbi:hypothetical protein SUGI_0383350 [Cryptomeria japonica]|nr:hypothetical protein SUGI_0383350 [Cryptomeria japonica]
MIIVIGKEAALVAAEIVVHTEDNVVAREYESDDLLAGEDARKAENDSESEFMESFLIMLASSGESWERTIKPSPSLDDDLEEEIIIRDEDLYKHLPPKQNTLLHISMAGTWQYADGDASNLVSLWNQWTTSVTTGQTQGFFPGLPASSEAAGSGFIPADRLISDVLPQIKKSHNYGGVMLWSEYYDEQTGYSLAIVEGVGQPNKFYVVLLKIIII